VRSRFISEIGRFIIARESVDAGAATRGQRRKRYVIHGLPGLGRIFLFTEWIAALWKPLLRFARLAY
jgi:hypothetical protein